MAFFIPNKKQIIMQLLNICTKKEFEINGNTITKWYKVGTLKIAESGKQYIKLFHQPNTEFFVFEKEPLAPEENQHITH